MDFRLTDIQKEFKLTAQKFFKEKCTLEELNNLEKSQNRYSDDLYNELVELGFLGLVIPEEYGGFGGELLDLAIVVEEAGKALYIGPFLSTITSGILPVLKFGSIQQKKTLLQAYANGELKVSFAVSEPQAHHDLKYIDTTAKRNGENFILNGIKLFVPFANSVDQLLVVARTSLDKEETEEGLTVFLIDTKNEGIHIEEIQSIGSESLYEVQFDDVVVEASQILGEVGNGYQVATEILNIATALQTIETSAILGRVVDMTAGYVKERHQFQVPIGSFQSVQHRLSDMFTIVEGGYLASYHAFSKLAAGKDATTDIAIAKAWLNQEGQQVVTGAHQLHGGMGIDIDYPLQICFRRYKAQQLAFGTTEVHLQKISEGLVNKEKITEITNV